MLYIFYIIRLVYIDGARTRWKVVEKLPSLATLSELGTFVETQDNKSAFAILTNEYYECPEEMMEIQWVNIVIMIVRNIHNR